MTPDALTILHAPCHGPSLDLAAIRIAVGLDADSIGWTEAYRRVPMLRRRLRYRTRVGNPRHAVNASIRGAHDVPIQVHRRNRLIEWQAIKACDPSTPLRVAPDRWITRVVFEHPIGRVEHVALHPNAAVMGHPLGVDRVEKYAATMERLESIATRAIRRGHHLVVTGDLNYRSGGPDYAPEAVFDRLDLDTWRIGLDWQARSPHLRLVDRLTLGEATTGQDHPWMRARYVL